MPSQYAGQAGNVSRPAALIIASSTNATPIQVTTSASHGLTSGDSVLVTNHQTNTAANGTWVIVVTGASTFTLTGSVGNGVGGATGTAQPLTANPESFQIPSDGDNRNASSVNAAFQALADRTAYSLRRIVPGGYHIAGVSVLPVQDDHMINVGWTVTVAAGSTYTLANVKVGTVTGVQPNDLVGLFFTSGAFYTGATIWGLCLAAANYAPGAAPPAASRIVGSEQSFGQQNSSYPVALMGVVPASILTVAGSVDVWLMGESIGSTGSIKVDKESTLIALVLRPN